MMNNDTIHFRDDQNNFRELLNGYRKEKKLTDVELQVGNKLFPAHRNVLSLYSPVLEAMISEQWLTTKICLISDEYVDVEIVEDLLNFLYIGSIDLTSDNVHSVCMAAHFLQISTLLNASVQHLRKQITMGNVLALFLFSTSCELPVLRKSCLEFISNNFGEVLLDSQILQYSSNDFNDLIVGLKNLCFGTSFPEHTFDCVVRWTETDLSERLNELPALLENIPLEEVSYRFLTQTVFKHPLVKESFPCIQSLLETLSFPSFEAAWDSELTCSNQDLIVISGQKADDAYSSVMNYYHVQSRTWRKLPDMLQRRGNFAVAVMNKRDIIISGGYLLDNGSTRPTGSVEMFSWNTHTWKKLPDMPVTMFGHSMAVHNGDLYVAGDVYDKKFSQLPIVFRYSFDTRQWAYVPLMTLRHYASRLISYKNLYAISGLWGYLERYDSARDEWTVMASTECEPISTRATVHQEKIYVSGLNKFQMYDPETDTWTSLPAPTIMRPKSLISLNGKLLAVTEKEYGIPIYEFDLSTQQWKEFEEISLNSIPHYAIVGDDY